MAGQTVMVLGGGIGGVGLLLAVAAMASVFSAACVVLTGVKSAEHRILAITRRERD